MPAVQGVRIKENVVRIRFAASADAKVAGDWDGDDQAETGTLTGNQLFDLVISRSRDSDGNSHIIKGRTRGRLDLKDDDQSLPVVEYNIAGSISGPGTFDGKTLSFTGLEFKSNGNKILRIDLILQGVIDVNGDGSVSPIDVLMLTGGGMLYFR